MVLNQPIALWAVPVADLGGVARHLCDVAAAGLPGFRLVVLSPPGPLVEVLAELGVAHLVDDFGPAAGPLRSAATLRRAVRTLRPAVVHTHLAYADVIAAAVRGSLPPGRTGGPAWVSTEHGIAGGGRGGDLVYHRSSAKSAAMARVHQARTLAADALIAVSEATAEAMRERWRVDAPIRVVPNGVDPAPTPEAGDRRDPRVPGLRVLSLSRLAPEKRLDRLIDAFARVAAAHPEATLVIAGTGDGEAALRAHTAAVGVADRVEFPGYLDAAAAMAEADVLVQLSTWENCSYALLDAVAAGLGVVATAVGGNPEILPEQCLVPPGAEPDAVAGAILDQGLHPDRRPTPGTWPTVARMCERIASIYQEVLR